MRNWRLFVILSGWLMCGSCLSHQAVARDKAPAEAKTDSLQYLQELRSKESKRLREINTSLAQRIEARAERNLDTEVMALKAQQREHQLRQEFLDRLIFQVDTKFGGGDLQAFLENALIEMAKVDAVTSAQADQGLWKFLKYSADAIHHLPEKKENVLAFLEGYMNKSIANPILPQDYLATRNYTNGSESESGQPLNREDAGNVADQRLHELNERNLMTAPAKAAAVEAPQVSNP